MPRDSHPTVDDSALPLEAGAAGKRSDRRASERRSQVHSARTWLEGSRTARRWNVDLLAWTALSVGAGTVASLVVRVFAPSSLSAVASPLLLWVGLIVPIVLAFKRSKPRGLLSFRSTDLLYGLVLGLALRTLQGWLAVAAGDSGALPSYPTLNGRLSSSLVLTAILAPLAVAPIAEELLFRGVVLVSVFRVARRGLEGALLSTVASVASFVALHAIDGIARWDEPVSLTLVAVTCSALVLLTGRIWSAVLVHLVFNASYVILALTGTLLN